VIVDRTATLNVVEKECWHLRWWNSPESQLRMTNNARFNDELGTSFLDCCLLASRGNAKPKTTAVDMFSRKGLTLLTDCESESRKSVVASPGVSSDQAVS
jgi:hypothetical protein